MGKDIKEMTKKDFLEVEINIPRKYFRSIVIVPTKNIHDSGYRCMKYIFVDEKNEIIGATNGYSDVMHINGIGGFGLRNKSLKERLEHMKPHGFKIDCLPKSQCLRIFCNEPLVVDDLCWTSDFEFFVLEKGDFKNE